MEIETFPALDLAGLRHGFSTRDAGPLEQLDTRINEALRAVGFPMDRAVHAEQTHGNRATAVEAPRTSRVPEVDALATSVVGLPLVVRVADCGPVFFYDPVKRAVAVAHSGRKGTEGNIVGATVACLRENYGSEPGDLVVQLGPCIRPPHYEVDFAAEIGRQARGAGVKNFNDGGVCTACRLERYYSYRAEKGKTGRMWGVIMLA
jgi:purine-nucleoside/S-methyl-5'-thioadenosine phosphorylase / adenosine deaminase